MIEGGIYVNSNENIWICLFEKKSDLRPNDSFLYTVELNYNFKVYNNFIIEQELYKQLEHKSLIFHKYFLNHFKSTDILTNGGYLGKINLNLLQTLNTVLHTDTNLVVE